MAKDQDINMAWSDLYPGLRIRWKTPTFVKRGTILSVKGISMRVRLDGETRERAIPHARWYFVEGKHGNQNEHLVVIAGKAPKFTAPKQELLERLVDSDGIISSAEAAALMGVDQKSLRRMVRNGKVPAQRLGGRWVFNRREIELRAR